MPSFDIVSRTGLPEVDNAVRGAMRAQNIVTAVNNSKLRVQVAIQADELRVSGKKRDDLQAVIALIKGLGVEQPRQ